LRENFNEALPLSDQFNKPFFHQHCRTKCNELESLPLISLNSLLLYLQAVQ